jgi:HlyD family secretion protein
MNAAGRNRQHALDGRPPAPMRGSGDGVVVLAAGGGGHPVAAGKATVCQMQFRSAAAVTVTATGTLQPTNQVDVGSEISGSSIACSSTSTTASQGQIIAQLDTQTLEARAASTRASLAVAEASLAQAQATVPRRGEAARSRELAARNIASQQTLETDEAAACVPSLLSRARRRRSPCRRPLARERDGVAQGGHPRANRRRHFSRDSAGSDGRGLVSDAGAFKLAGDLRHMELHLDLDESDVGQVREGAANFVSMHIPGAPSANRVRALQPARSTA